MTTQKISCYLRCTLLIAGAIFVAEALAAPINIWLTEADTHRLQRHPEKAASLISHCDREMTTTVSPVAVIAPPPHYTGKGVDNTGVPLRLGSDGNLAYRAALCYVITQDARYAQHAQTIISAWSDTLQSAPTEQGAADINFSLPQYVLAASMVRHANAWNDGSFQRLLTQIALPLSRLSRDNNHANWGVFLTASIAAYVGDVALLDKARARWLVLMDRQIAADGSLLMEICRSDSNNYCDGASKGINGLSYTHFTLLPTSAAARIFDIQGKGVWKTPEGDKLATAYRKAAAWTLHPETFPYFESNGGKLNGVRNAAYFVLLQQQYPNPDGADVIAGGKLGMNGLEWLFVFNASVDN